VYKIHGDALGYHYYFDAYALQRKLRGWHMEKRYVYLPERDLHKRIYALSFAMVELVSRNYAKCRAFLDTVKNAHNMWEIPL
jgi:hypothetical protein